MAIGAIALAMLLVVQGVPSLSGNSPAGITSDEFDGTSLSPAWTFINPVADGTVSVVGGAVSITSPNTANHDIWTSGIDAPRIMQSVLDGDFKIEARFDSGVTSKYQLQGFLAKDAGDNYLRFGNYSNGSGSKAFAAAINPVASTVQVHLNQSIPAATTSYFRLTRAGSLWTFERSLDGTTWQVLTSFSAALALSEIGLYGGNVGSASHTAVINYFRDVSPSSPTAFSDSYTTDEDVTLSVVAPGVLGNDTDPELDPLTAVLETDVSNGVLTLNADGSFSYTPNANFNGPDSFTYRATDGGSISTPATVSITVNAVNDAPVATPQSVVTEQDVAVAVTLAATDADNDPLTYTVTVPPLHGDLTGSAPNLTYTPTTGYFGPDSFEFTASDAVSTSAAATVSITVYQTNAAPVAVDDPSYSVDEDSVLNIAAPGVLANDTDADLDPLTAELVSNVTNGVLTLNADGSFSYTPNANFNGVDTFTYIARDAVEASAPATATITVNPVNDVPVAVAQTVSTAKDVPVAITLSATDVDGDALTYVVTVEPLNGVLSGSAPNVTYTPALGYTGPDSFSFTASDAVSTSAPAAVDITVTAPGLIFSDEFSGTSLAPAWTFVNPLTDGSVSVSGGAVSIVSPNTVDHNVWTTGIDAPRIMQQVPDADFAVEAKFNSGVALKYQLQGFLVNDTAGNYLRFGNYNNGSVTKAFVAAINPVANTVDIFLNDSIPASGTSYLRLSRAGDLWTFERSADGTTWQTLSSITHPFTVSEIGLYSGNVGRPSHTAVVDYFRDVTPAAPTAPAASDDTYVTDEDVTLVVPAPGVLSNDVDPEGDPLTAVLETGPTNGTLTLNADGSFTYVPAPNFNGSDSFTYRATDGVTSSNIALVTLNVTAVNDVPTVQDLSVSVEQDTSVAVTLIGADADNDPLTYTVTAAPLHGTLSGNAPNLTYTPAVSYVGPDSFTYTASDAVSTSPAGTVSITVFAPNAAPVAVDDAYSVDEDVTLNVPAPGVLVNDTDTESDPLTVQLVTGALNGTVTLNADGSFSYVPNLNFNGTDSFTYVAKDAQKTSPAATVSITVNAVNDAPVAIAQSVSVLVNTATPITLGAVDVENDPLTFLVTTGPLNGVLSGSAPDLTYTPNPGYIGADSFEFTASDATLTSAPAAVQINVYDGNAPVITFFFGDSQKFNNIGRPQVWADVLGNVDDPDGITSLTYKLNGGPSQTLTVGPDGRRLQNAGDFIVQLPFNSLPVGTNHVEVTAVDTLGNTAVRAMTFNYAGRNFWPTTYSTDWSSTVDIQDAVQVVDGNWVVGPNGLTNAGFTGYDRLVALGDIAWTDYTATVPVTVNNWDPSGNWCCGLGLIIRWQGHTNDPVVCAQPSCGWEPSGNHVWYQWDATGGHSSKFAGTSNTLQDTSGMTLQLGVTYMIKVEVETVGSDNWYRKKVWVQGEPEPANWLVEVIRNSKSLPSGSLLLIAHHLDVTFGDIQITPVGAAPSTSPTAFSDSYSTDEDVTLSVVAPGVLGNDTDPELDPLTAVLETDVSNGVLTLNADGSFSYTPNANFNGPDSFTYRATDGGSISTPATVSITVNAVNDAPVATPQSVVTEQDVAVAVTLAATDADGDPLTYTVTTLPLHGDLTGTAPNLTYTPVTGYFGPDSFEFTASDTVSTSTTATVSITVYQTNAAPVAVDDPSYSVDEDSVLNIAAPGVLANDTDADLDPLTAELVSNVTNGVLTLNADGSFSYTPNANFNGVDTFTYIARDAVEASAPATATITVNPVNDVPVAIAQSVSTAKDVPVAITLSATDVDGDALTYVVAVEPSNGVLSGAAPDVTYTPALGYTGPDSFSFTASDAVSTSAPAVVDITVTAVGLIFSDEFSGTSLAPAWTFVNPLTDGSVSVSGGAVSIVSPNTANHDIWSSGVDAPRIMQQVSDIDFAVEAKFDSGLTQKYQLQGFLLKLDDGTYLRVGNYHNGKSVKSFVAVIDPISGTAQTISTQNITAFTTSYLRLTRVGDLWTFERSADGTTWQVLASFTRTLTMTEIGVYSGNVGTPSHTAVVDYFRDVTGA